jgi:hypothetical protein
MSRKKLEPATFETGGCSGYLRLYHDMLTSPAWGSLSLRQRGLYLAFKGLYKEKRADGKIISSNKDEIHFSGQEATKPGSDGEKPLYGDQHTFFKDLDALIDAGFIRVVQTGYYTRSATVYGFSDRWRKYQSGKPPEIPMHEKRLERTHKKEAVNG